MRFITKLMVLAAVAFAVRKFLEDKGPELRQRCASKCEQMLEQMPESFPPNRMLADLAAIKDNTAQILDALDRTQD